MGSVTDIHLPAFKADQPGAIEAIWSRYVHRVLSLTQVKLKQYGVPDSECDPDDIWNLVFQRLCHLRNKDLSAPDQNSLRNISTQSRLYSWFFVTVTRRVIDVRRRIAKRTALSRAVSGNEDSDEFQSLEQLAVDYATDVFQQVSLEEFIGQLPPDLRDAAERIAFQSTQVHSESDEPKAEKWDPKLKPTFALLFLFFESRGGRIPTSIGHCLRKLREKLPSEQEACVSMTLQGLSRATIARHLNADPVQVDIWLDRAHQQLQYTPKKR